MPSLESPAGSGLGEYLIEVDRTGLTPGSYRAEILFQTDVAGSYTLVVTLQVAATEVAVDIGPQTLALLDTQTDAVRYRLQVVFDPLSSTYIYRFPAVEAGSYQLVAGSDLDNDGRLCDAGEACGRYPVAVEIVDQNLDGFDFSSAFE